MITPDYFIDSVQNGKRYVVNTFVQDEKVRKGLLSVIDAQTEFVKTAAKTSLELTQLYFDNITKSVKIAG